MNLARKELAPSVQGDQLLGISVVAAEEDLDGPVSHVESAGGVEAGNDSHDQAVHAEIAPADGQFLQKRLEAGTSATADLVHPCLDESPVEWTERHAIGQGRQGNQVEPITKPSGVHPHLGQSRPEDGRGTESPPGPIAVDVRVHKSRGPGALSLVKMVIEDDDGNRGLADEGNGLDGTAAAVEDDEKVAAVADDGLGCLAVKSVSLTVTVRNIIAHPGPLQKAVLDGQSRRSHAVDVIIAVDDKTRFRA
jgi:hypothetical protein